MLWDKPEASAIRLPEKVSPEPHDLDEHSEHVAVVEDEAGLLLGERRECWHRDHANRAGHGGVGGRVAPRSRATRCTIS